MHSLESGLYHLWYIRTPAEQEAEETQHAGMIITGVTSQNYASTGQYGSNLIVTPLPIYRSFVPTKWKVENIGHDKIKISAEDSTNSDPKMWDSYNHKVGENTPITLNNNADSHWCIEHTEGDTYVLRPETSLTGADYCIGVDTGDIVLRAFTDIRQTARPSWSFQKSS